MLKIKLLPRGKKHQRTFRLVVAEDRTKYNGNFVADLGFYTPQTKTLDYNKEELAKWVKNGAQITLGVDKLINPDKHIRPPKVKVAKPKTEEIKETPKTEETSSEESVKVETAEN